MAITYQLIQGYTLTGTQSSITFSSIPQTFTDLVLVGTLRDTANVGVNSPYLRVNGLSTTVYSAVRGLAAGTSTASSSNSGNTEFTLNGSDPGSGTTANTFSNFQIYFASYRVGFPRSFNYYSTFNPDNATEAQFNMNSLRLEEASAITSISVFQGSFATGSTLDLYGILEF